MTTAALNTKTTEIENKIPDAGYKCCSENKSSRNLK